jgi:hypothetical protein
MNIMYWNLIYVSDEWKYFYTFPNLQQPVSEISFETVEVNEEIVHVIYFHCPIARHNKVSVKVRIRLELLSNYNKSIR